MVVVSFTCHSTFSVNLTDVTETLLVEVDQIYHLACPASPIFYKYNPVKVSPFHANYNQFLSLLVSSQIKLILLETSSEFSELVFHI